MRQTALGFLVAAIAAIILGWPEVGLFLAITAGGLAILAPDAPHRDARRRNQARRVR